MSLIGKCMLWIALCAITSPVFAAQDHQHDTDSLQDAHARMKELMGKVESRLKSIDELLDDASARDKSLSPTDASAIDKVLVPNAKNEELKALIVKVRPAFVAHLEHAKMVQKSLK